MDWLIFIFAIELGYNPSGSFIIWEGDTFQDSTYIDQTFYSQLEVEMILFNLIGIGTETRINMFNKNIINWSPFNIRFLIFTHAFFYGFDIGIRFFCTHPIVPYAEYESDFYLEGWYRELYIRYEAKIGGKK